MLAKQISHCILLLLLSICSQTSAAKESLSAFNKNSMNKIEQAYARKPFLLVLWSIECAPCRDELALLGDLKQQYKDMNLVLVSTDDISQKPLLNKILNKYQLSEIDNWAFASKNAAQLRYSIDPQWFGEMPRSYFYDAKHQRQGLSGKLKKETIIDWLTPKPNS